MDLNNDTSTLGSPVDRWEKFDVVTTRKNSRKASLFSAPGNLEVTTNVISPQHKPSDNVTNPAKNGPAGDVTLLNNNDKAPKRRLSSYTSSAIEAVRKSERKRSSLLSNGFGELIETAVAELIAAVHNYSVLMLLLKNFDVILFKK